MGIESEIETKILFLNNKMQFVFNEKSMQNLMNEAFGGAEPLFRLTGNCPNPGFGKFCSTSSGNNRFGTGKWTHKINLDRLPTKPEDLHVKMENESETLSVSGKSEVNTDDKNGMKIFSVHNWQNEIPVPENLDLTTLACKMKKNWVVFNAEFKKQEILITSEEKTEETEIPIEKLD